MALNKNERRERRKKSIRNKISGTAETPRLTIFKSLNHIYVQVIDDEKGNTLCSASTKDKEYKGKKGCNIDSAKAVGELLADRCKKLNIKSWRRMFRRYFRSERRMNSPKVLHGLLNSTKN